MGNVRGVCLIIMLIHAEHNINIYFSYQENYLDWVCVGVFLWNNNNVVVDWREEIDATSYC